MPEERGFYERTWFHKLEKDFKVVSVGKIKIGVLICTELMFNEIARLYGLLGADVIFVPRATRKMNLWITAGKMASIVSGAFVLSSNRVGNGFCGGGFVVSPNGKLMAKTTRKEMFVTIDIDLEESKKAKDRYPITVWRHDSQV